MKNGTPNDFMTLNTIVSGALAFEFEVRVFAMNDAVWALRNDTIGLEKPINSYFPAYSELLSSARDNGSIPNGGKH
jgi:peroxiredoxin family protein